MKISSFNMEMCFIVVHLDMIINLMKSFLALSDRRQQKVEEVEWILPSPKWPENEIEIVEW